VIEAQRTNEGAQRITAVGWPSSWWAELESRVGHRLTTMQRTALQTAMDAPPVTTWAPTFKPGSDEWTYRGRRLAEFHPYVNDPAAFVRMNLA
jgi:hypothetical protein